MEIIRTVFMIIIGLVILKLFIDLIVLLFFGALVEEDQLIGEKTHQNFPQRSHHHTINSIK